MLNNPNGGEKKRLTTAEKINIAIELSGLILTIIGLIHTW